MLMRSRPGCLRSCSWRRRRTTRFLHNNNFAADNFKARSDLWNTAFPSVRTSYLVSYAQFYFILSKNKVSLENIFIQSIFLRILPTSSPSTRPSRPSWPPTPNGSNHCWPWVRISLTKRSAAAARRPSREVWWPTWPFFYTYEIFISCFISLSLSIYIFPFYLRLFSLSLSIYIISFSVSLSYSLSIILPLFPFYFIFISLFCDYWIERPSWLCSSRTVWRASQSSGNCSPRRLRRCQWSSRRPTGRGPSLLPSRLVSST